MKNWKRTLLEWLIVLLIYVVVLGTIYVGGIWVGTGQLPWNWSLQ